MDQREKNIQIAESIETAKRIAVMPSNLGGVDTFSAAAGLYHLLKEKDKYVDFIYSGAVPVQCEQLLDKNLIKNSVGSKELVVSIDYASSPDAKAQYSTNNGVLYLKLSPIVPDFDISKVQSEIHGDSYDLIFTVGIATTEDFGPLAHEFSKAKVVNIDNVEANQKHGTYNVVETQESSVSLLVLNTSRFWRLKVTPSSAKALLQGISHGMA